MHIFIHIQSYSYLYTIHCHSNTYINTSTTTTTTTATGTGTKIKIKQKHIHIHPHNNMQNNRREVKLCLWRPFLLYTCFPFNPLLFNVCGMKKMWKKKKKMKANFSIVPVPFKMLFYFSDAYTVCFLRFFISFFFCVICWPKLASSYF